jgi:hypothetical protein
VLTLPYLPEEIVLPALITGLLVYFVFTRRWFWITIAVLWAIGMLHEAHQ